AAAWTAARGWARGATRRDPAAGHTPVPTPATPPANRATPDRTGARACAAGRVARASPRRRRAALPLDQRAAAADTAGGPGGRPLGTAPTTARLSPASARPHAAPLQCSDRVAGESALGQGQRQVTWEVSYSREQAALRSILPYFPGCETPSNFFEMGLPV